MCEKETEKRVNILYLFVPHIKWKRTWNCVIPRIQIVVVQMAKLNYIHVEYG